MKKYPQLAWRWLTSMRTALVLLFLLAIAAIPGALLPQRSLNESKVAEYIANGGKTAEIYDKLQLFDVFSSTWFTAIYILLFISLIGCIIPRTIDHYRASRNAPVRAPLRMQRLPHRAFGTPTHPGTPEEILDHAQQQLKGWRTARYTGEQDRAGYPSLSAERGYGREICNLIFHLGLVGMLASIGLGKMYYYEGQAIVVTNTGVSANGAPNPTENSEFCNTALANYDSVRAGALFKNSDLTPFCIDVHDFHADYLPNGQAEMFNSNISYADGENIFAPKDQWKNYDLRVNHPLRLDGDRIYLQGHGFAPRFTITWPNGETRTQMIQFAPEDATYFLSSGVLRFDPPSGMYPTDYERRQNQLAIQGLFAPTAQFSGENNALLSSSYPEQKDPAVAIDIYRGDNGLDTGRGQNIFTLDPQQLHNGSLQKIERVNLMLGDSVTLDDGTKVTFDGANEFINLQVSHDPFQQWVLISTITTLAGLVGSLAIKRRRIWIRVTNDGIEMGGLSRTDRAGWGSEFDRLARQLVNLEPTHTQQEPQTQHEPKN